MLIKKCVLPLLLGSSLFLVGCVHDNVFAPTAPYTQAEKTTDAKILGTLVALNKAEITASVIAQSKASNTDVVQYAIWMQNAHTQNLQQTEALSQKLDLKPINGPTAINLQHKAAAIANRLKHTSKNRFDQVYMRDMVKGHREALQLVTKLETMATNPAVKAQLHATQGHVQAHLNRAVAIESKISH